MSSNTIAPVLAREIRGQNRGSPHSRISVRLEGNGWWRKVDPQYWPLIQIYRGPIYDIIKPHRRQGPILRTPFKALRHIFAESWPRAGTGMSNQASLSDFPRESKCPIFEVSASKLITFNGCWDHTSRRLGTWTHWFRLAPGRRFLCTSG